MAMKIRNQVALERQIKDQMGRNLHLAADSLIYELVTHELPSGLASPLATKIRAVRDSATHVQVVIEDPVWDYLSQGTGIYSSDGEHRGAGQGGAIVPLYAQALHFKDRQIAAALGLKGDDVYLKKVKGIKPRFFWDKYFNNRRLKEKMNEVKKQMKGIDIYSRK
ncbi:Uncharacterised protein [Candidatus Anstonella stagnisolia]|nr:Uncharacterised protein [Candidatus Anstonella stagnisolia]